MVRHNQSFYWSNLVYIREAVNNLTEIRSTNPNMSSEMGFRQRSKSPESGFRMKSMSPELGFRPRSNQIGDESGTPRIRGRSLSLDLGKHRVSDPRLKKGRLNDAARRWNDVVSAISAFSKVTSAHGFAWHNRTENTYLKHLMALLLLVVLCALPAVIITELVHFLTDKKALFAIESHEDVSVPYPNISLCHPKYFDSNLMREYNVSDDLASYMTMALGSSVRNITEFMQHKFNSGEYRQLLERYVLELRQVLDNNNFTDLLQLYQAIAIRCDEFIFMCDDHSRFYGSRHSFPGIPPCCGNLFEETPFFTPAGTCFASKNRPVETYPATYNSIKIWVRNRKANTPKLSMNLLGSDASERTGAMWAVNDKDIPATSLFHRPRQIRPGTTLQVALSQSKVDRSRLSSLCMSKNKTFENLFGIESTKSNCLLMEKHFQHQICSSLIYAGLASPRPNAYPCLPKDVWTSGPRVTKHAYKGPDLNCLNDCFETRNQPVSA